MFFHQGQLGQVLELGEAGAEQCRKRTELFFFKGERKRYRISVFCPFQWNCWSPMRAASLNTLLLGLVQLTSFQFLKQISLVPISGPLHLLFPLPGMLFSWLLARPAPSFSPSFSRNIIFSENFLSGLPPIAFISWPCWFLPQSLPQWATGFWGVYFSVVCLPVRT